MEYEPPVEVIVAFVDDGGRYPFARGDDPVLEYWKAIAVMAASLRAAGMTWTVSVATNRPPVDTRVRRVLDEQAVTFRSIPFDHAPPENYFDRFSGSFFLLDAIADAVERTEDETVLIFVDPDCVWYGDPQAVVDAVALSPEVPLAYEVSYCSGQPAIGQTQEDLGQLYSSVATDHPVPKRPPYAGGEFLAGTSKGMSRLLPHIEAVWAESLRRFEVGEPVRANTEEHVLSYALGQVGWTGGTANDLVRRLWTKLPPERNIRGDEDELVVWHTLREKGRGLSELFEDLASNHPAFHDGGSKMRRHLARRLRVRLTPIARAKGVLTSLLYGRRREYPVEW